MSWFPKFFGKKSAQPRDSQAPLKSLMSSAPKAGGQMGENARMKRELLGSFKKGGIVKKTGAYKLHKGEEVIPAKKREMAGKMKYKTMSVPKSGKFDPTKWELRTTSFGDGAGGTDTDRFLVRRSR